MAYALICLVHSSTSSIYLAKKKNGVIFNVSYISLSKRRRVVEMFSQLRCLTFVLSWVSEQQRAFVFSLSLFGSADEFRQA